MFVYFGLGPILLLFAQILLLQVNYLGDEDVFSPEQLYAMLLTELKNIAEKGLGKGVQDCVISVSTCNCSKLTLRNSYFLNCIVYLTTMLPAYCRLQ